VASFDGHMPFPGNGQPAMFSYIYLVTMFSCCFIYIWNNFCYLFGKIKFFFLGLKQYRYWLIAFWALFTDSI